MFPSNFWKFTIYADDTKATTKASTSQIVSVDRTLQLNQAFNYTVTCLLTDANTANIVKNAYCELKVGLPVPSKLWVAGYVQDVKFTGNRQNELAITIYSASKILDFFRSTGNLWMKYPTFKTIEDVLNGVKDSSGNYSPGHKGILTGSGLTAKWQDVAGNPIPGFEHGNGLDPHVSWDTATHSLNVIGSAYNGDWVDDINNKRSSGTLYVGPLGKSSGQQFWGGQALTDKQNASDGRNRTKPNANKAQLDGLAVITGATREEHMDNVVNLIWGVGHGTNYETMVTLRSYWTDSPDVVGTPYQPVTGGRLYYLGPNQGFWNGNTYTLVAAQEQTSGEWAYGVLNKTSADKYGRPTEGWLKRPDLHDAYSLLTAMLGACDYNSDPVETWILGVQQPLTSADGVPRYPNPGQTVDVRYYGQVHDSLKVDTNSRSSTYGQWIGNGPYIYAAFPGPGIPDPTHSTAAGQTINGHTYTQAEINKLTRVIEFSDSWSGHNYTQTITTGKGKKRGKHYIDALARQFEQHRKQHDKKYSWHKHTFEGIPFWFSHNPDAWEDPSQGTINLSPGAILVSDCPHTRFFDDHHSVEFNVQFGTTGSSDDTQVLDFWFAKPVKPKSVQSNPGVTYALFRLALPKSGKKSGFFTTSDGTNYTSHGSLVHRQLFDNHGQLINPVPGVSFTARVKISWSGGTYEAHVSYVGGGSIQSHDVVAVWHDHLKAITTFGQIGWQLSAGKQNAQLSVIHAHPMRKKSRAVSGGRGKKKVTIHEPGKGAGHEHRVVDETSGVPHIAHSVNAEGEMAHRRDHIHGHYHQHDGTATADIVGGTTASITFTSALPAYTVHPGMVAQIVDSVNPGDYAVVSVVTRQADNTITGIACSAPFASDHTAASGWARTIRFDPLDSDSPIGHRNTTIKAYNPNTKRMEWAKAHVTVGGGRHLVFDDGTSVSKNVVQHDAAGASLQVAQLSVGGEHLATELEQHGAVIWDAGGFSSSAQKAYRYSGTSGTELALNVNGATTQASPVTPSSTNFYGGSPYNPAGPSGTLVSWLSNTVTDAAKGIADSIFQETTAAASDTILMQDTNCVDEDGTARTFTVKKDATFAVPVYIDTGNQTTTTQTFGATLNLARAVTGGTSPTITVDVDPALTGMLTGTGNQWTLNPGGSTQETLTVSSFDSTAYTITFTANVANAHATGEVLHCTLHNGVAVHSGGTLADEHLLDDTVPQITAIAVGYYDGTKWYRGWWGDPSWKAPYLSDTGLPGYISGQSMSHLGKLTGVKPGTWATLKTKASKLGLFGPGINPVKISGAEMAIYGPAGGLTCYFDAHQHGFSSHPTKQPTASGGTKQPPGDVRPGTIHPTHPSNGTHHHFYWVQQHGDTKWYLNWETGKFLTHDSGTTFNDTIYGTTEDAPSGGILAMPIDHSNVALGIVANGNSSDATDVNNSLNHFIVLNTKGGFWVKDPGVVGGKSWVPGYIAGNNSGTQTAGFAILTEKVNWHARKGAANDGSGNLIYQGVPHWCIKVGKIDATTDFLTGEPAVKSSTGSGKHHGGKHRKGSHGPGHKHPSNHSIYHFHSCTFTTSGGASPKLGISGYNGSVPTLVRHDGKTWTLPVTADLGLALAAGDIIWLTVPASSATSISTGAFNRSSPGSTDMTARSSVTKVKLGYLSNALDTYTGNAIFHSYFTGTHENHGSNNQAGSVAPGHKHDSNHETAHFDGTLQVRGKRAPFIVLSGKGGNNAKFVNHKGSVFSFGFTNSTVVASPTGWPSGSNANAPGAAIVFKLPAYTSNIVTAANFETRAAGTNLTTMTNPHQYMHVGWLSETRGRNGQYSIKHRHPGAHEHHTENFAPATIMRDATHPAHHPHRGHFVGGTFKFSGGGTPTLNFDPEATNSWLGYIPDDATGWNGSGANAAVTPVTDRNQSTTPGTFVQLLGSGNINNFQAPIAGNLVMFCPLLTSVNGLALTNLDDGGVTYKLTAGTTYVWRIAFSQLVNGTNIETVPTDIVTGTGHGGYQFTLTPPDPVDSTWAVNLYLTTTAAGYGTEAAQTLNTHYTTSWGTDASGNPTVQVTIKDIRSPNNGNKPSFGFCCFPSNTDITASTYDQLVKVGHLSNNTDATGHYTLHGYLVGSHEVSAKHVRPSALRGNHMNWQSIVGGNSTALTNGAMTAGAATTGNWSITAPNVSYFDTGSATTANNLLLGNIQVACAAANGSTPTSQTSGWGQPLYPIVASSGTSQPAPDANTQSVMQWVDNAQTAGITVLSISVNQQNRQGDTHSKVTVVWQAYHNLTHSMTFNVFFQALGLTAT